MRSNYQRAHPTSIQRARQERGAIILFVALGLVVLIGMVGLAIDLGHAYVNKSQLQNIADACALAGASALDGTAAGIANAQNRATDAEAYLANLKEFNADTVTIPPAAVTYSASLNGPWLDAGGAQGVADTIRFVQVIVPAQTTAVLFAKVVPGIPAVMNFGAEAVAGRMPLTKVCGGLDPFSPIRITETAPNYGYVDGDDYMLRLAPGNSGLGTGCTGSVPPLPLGGSVTGNFGFADSAGCGPSLECFRDAILRTPSNTCVEMGPGALPTTTGNMGNAAVRAMQDRYELDTDETTYTDYSQYVAAGLGNSSRVLRVAFNDGTIPPGTSDDYNVIAFGCFFMRAPIPVSPPASALCLEFIGSCDLAGNSNGGNEPSITKTVLFR